MNRVFVCLLAFIFLLSAASSAAFEFNISADKVSLQAEQVPLQDILKRFSDGGIRVRIDPQINPLISASFKELPLQKGLTSILKSLNHVLLWESSSSLKGAAPRLAEIQVFRPGRKEAMRPLASSSVLSLDRDPKTGALFVKNELLVTLKPGVTLSEFENLLVQIGGRITGYYTATGVYRIRLPDGADVPALVESILEQPEVARAEPNYVYPTFDPYRISGLTVPELPKVSGLKDAVPIAIIDTGFRREAGSELERLVLASLDSLNPGSPISDNLGHGTQMALIASGVVKPAGFEGDLSPHIPLIPIRAIDENGFVSGFQLMQGIEFAINSGARVLSLSWGGETYSGFMESAMNEARSRGLVVVASAGNEPTGKAVYPAAYPSVIGVGALDQNGKIWSESNFGSSVSLYAPGVASLPVGYKGDPGSYAGTSIAAAFMANRIALYLSIHPDASIEEYFDALRKKKEP